MRKTIQIVSAICFAVLILLAILVYRASPGPLTQEILGVGISSSDSVSEIVYLSGRRLDCDRIDGTRAFASCTVDIAGKTLEIHARRNLPTDPHQLGGTCEAFYDGQQWPCSIDSRHVHVHWYAYVHEPLGLTGDQFHALRRDYFFENLPQEAFISGMVIVPIVAMLVAMLVTAVWFWPKARRKVSFVLLVAASGVATLSGTFVLAFLLTRDFWD